MDTLKVLNFRDYKKEWEIFHRDAVRAVIVRGGKVMLVKSRKAGYYKFPGGGIEPGESQIQALIRETLEETGLHIRPETIKPFINIVERRRKYEEEVTFEQCSYYFTCEVSEQTSAPALTDDEKALDFTLCCVSPKEAEHTDFAIAQHGGDPLLFREGYVLALLSGQKRFFAALPEVVGTCWHEFTNGTFDGDHWNSTSIYISDDDMEDTGLIDQLISIVPNYDRYGISHITANEWNTLFFRAETIGGTLFEAVKQADAFMLDVLEAVDYITILGI